MSSAGLGSTTTLLGGSPSGQAAGHVNNQTQFTLVLGGGGMKGVAHVGVLQALTERGLVPSQIVGSSVGALVGAAWSAGKSIAELREIATGLVRKDIFAVAHADMAFKRMRSPALFRREPLDQLLHRLVGDVTFQDLRNRLIVNTVDLNSGMQVFWGLEGLDEVLVRDAVFASCALPGYLPPREIRGRFYMDGATVDNLPVGTARILGSEVIIAVDVSASNALRADTQEEGFASVFARAAEIAMQVILELRLREWTTPPIYYIHPRVEHISAFDFDHLREVVEEGYRATIAALDRPAEWPGPGDVGVHPLRPVTVRVQRERCIGCGACLVQAPPGMFVLDAQGKAVVTRPDQEWSPIDGAFIRHCPTYAISARPAPPVKHLPQRRYGVRPTQNRSAAALIVTPESPSRLGGGPARAATIAATRLSSSSSVKKWGDVPRNSRCGGMSDATTGVAVAIASKGVSPKPSNVLGQTTSSAVR